MQQIPQLMKKENITVGYLSSKNPKDRRSWSGTHYRMLCALEKEFDNIEIIAPLRLHFSLSFFLKLKNFGNKILYKKKYNKAHCKLRSKYYANIISKRIKGKNIDVLFAPVGCVEIAYLETDIPICYLSDTTFNQIKGYYGSFSGISQKSIEEANLIEQRSIDNSHVQVFSSDWAANYAKEYYKAKKPIVIKFGANIDAPPPKQDIVKDYNGNINILFLGVDWERKGGDIVLDTIKKLEKKHHNFHLTVCGCTPPEKHPKMTVIPFLNKNKKEDRTVFNQLLSESHILFVPTRADCTPIVFCEANAYGMPVITTDTGGVTSVIEQGVNGYALPKDAEAEEYAEKISYLLNNVETLKKLSISSRNQFEKELNWDIWGSKMKKLFENFVLDSQHLKNKKKE